MTARTRLTGLTFMLTLIATALIAACGGADPTPTSVPMPTAIPTPTTTTPDTGTGATFEATIANLRLPNFTISAGTAVTWIQADSIPHTTTSGTGGVFDGLGWDSESLKTNESFSHTFNETGTFPYTCRLHPYMSATVIVTDE